MKRFLLFEGNNYYPYGGWDDFSSSFDTLEEAKAGFNPKKNWHQIVDLETESKFERIKSGAWI